jgi:hypothetical protein
MKGMKRMVLLAGMAVVAISLVCAGCSAANTPLKVTEAFIKAVKNNNMAAAKKYAAAEMKAWLRDDFKKLYFTSDATDWNDISIVEVLSAGYTIPEVTYTDRETRITLEVITNYSADYQTTGRGDSQIYLAKAEGGSWLASLFTDGARIVPDCNLRVDLIKAAGGKWLIDWLDTPRNILNTRLQWQ